MVPRLKNAKMQPKLANDKPHDKKHPPALPIPDERIRTFETTKNDPLPRITKSRY
jgi:hypothetical protein